MTPDANSLQRHRPAWHAVAPATHWMNDPNGLWRDGDGLWHLWFQYRDNPPAYSRTHWGRLVSADGLVWRLAGTDFAADADGDIYSGCVVDVGVGIGIGANVVVQRAYVTRHEHGRGSAAGAPPPAVRQSVESWQRDGPKAAWQPAPATTRVDPGLRDFRDPFVFRYGNGWRMLVAEPCPWDAAAPGPARSRLQVWRSADGLHWEPAGAFGPWDPPRVMWEVPQLLPLSALQDRASVAPPQDGGLWLLLVSVLDRREGKETTAESVATDIACSVRWHVGTFDGARFEPLADSAVTATAVSKSTGGCVTGRLLDHGPDCYAACLQTPDHARPAEPALVAWMSHWAYARHLPLPDFAGGPMTLPRRLSWRADSSGNGLRQQPTEALVQKRAAGPLVTPMQVLTGARCTVARSLGSLDLEMGLHMAAGGQAWLRLGESESGSKTETAPAPLALHIDAGAGRITLHRAPLANLEPGAEPQAEAIPAFAGTWPADWTPDVSGEVSVRLLLDGCCAEIYIDAGALVFSALVFPSAGAVCTLSAEVGAQVVLRAGQAWVIEPRGPSLHAMSERKAPYSDR